MRNLKADKFIRKKYLISSLTAKKEVSSLISSNQTVYLSSLCITFLFLILIQASLLKRQMYIYYYDVPYTFYATEGGEGEGEEHVSQNLDTMLSSVNHMEFSTSHVEVAPTLRWDVEDENVRTHRIQEFVTHKHR
jgi:hypothetical protein